MRIVHTADWHIGKSLNDYSLLEDQRYYFDRFIEQLSIIKPDALIIAGDLYDRSIPSAEAISLLNDILCKIVLELKIKTFIIAGNHDSKERLSFGNALLQKSGLYIFGSIENPITKISLETKHQAVNFFMLPYFEAHNVKSLFPHVQVKSQQEAFDFYMQNAMPSLDESQINILVAHGFFGGSSTDYSDEKQVGASEIVNISHLSKFDYVALGHLHSCRTAGADAIRYSGSPLKYSIDEANQNKGFLLIEFDFEKKVSCKIEKLKPLRDVRVIEGSFSFLSDRTLHTDFEDYVFMNITDDAPTLNAIGILRDVFPNVLGLKYSSISNKNLNSLLPSSAEIKSRSESELFADFYKNVYGSEIEPEALLHVEELLNKLKGGIV